LRIEEKFVRVNFVVLELVEIKAVQFGEAFIFKETPDITFVMLVKRVQRPVKVNSM
jgi:hypothetical protein